MPSFTKKAIIDSFLRIASKKSLDKITVRDIVDDCGVNRNTFYYYFQDIYAVLEEICRNGVEHVPRGLSLPDMMKTTFEVLSGYALLYPRVMRQVAINVGVEGSERYFGEAFDALFTESITLAAGKDGYPPELPSFLRHAFLGIFIDWMREEKRIPAEKAAAALEEIGKVVLAGLRGENSPDNA